MLLRVQVAGGGCESFCFFSGEIKPGIVSGVENWTDAERWDKNRVSLAPRFLSLVKKNSQLRRKNAVSHPHLFLFVSDDVLQARCPRWLACRRRGGGVVPSVRRECVRICDVRPDGAVLLRERAVVWWVRCDAGGVEQRARVWCVL